MCGESDSNPLTVNPVCELKIPTEKQALHAEVLDLKVVKWLNRRVESKVF